LLASYLLSSDYGLITLKQEFFLLQMGLHTVTA
jgi:hypothetical protein